MTLNDLLRVIRKIYDKVDISEDSSLLQQTLSTFRPLNPFSCPPPRFPLSFLWSLLLIMGLAVWPLRFRPGCRVELHTFITDCDTELPCRFVPTGSLFPNPLIRVENKGKERDDGTIWNGRGGTLEKTPCDSFPKPNKRTWDWYYEALDAHMCV